MNNNNNEYNKRFKTFEDLEIYKKAREFRKKIYELIRKLPPEEKYNLDPQIRRSVVSITNNIAEGHGRYHYSPCGIINTLGMLNKFVDYIPQGKENIQFCRHSRGSLEEIIDDLNVCLDEKYFSDDYISKLKTDGFNLLEDLNSYIKYLKKMKEESEC